MTVKTIKGVDEEVWAEFKSMAAKSGRNMGDFFGILVDNYKNEAKGFWDRMLNREPTLTDEEAEEMLKVSKEIRKEYGFRDKL